jgi:hypothetical protein
LGLAIGSLKPKNGQREVDEAVLVLLDVRLAVDHLVELEVDQACDQRSRGGNGRNDLAGNELGLVPIG